MVAAYARTMDIKEIATKVVDGGNVEEVIKDFDEAKKAEFYKTLKDLRKEAADKELDRTTGIRKERERLEADKTETEAKALETIQTKIRGEQISKARAKFMSEQGLKEEDMKSVDEAFKTEDSGKFDADLIIPDLRRAYVKANPDRFIEAERVSKEQQRHAAEFNSSGSSGGTTGGGGDGSKQYSPQVHEWVREAAKKGITMTLDEAERGLKGGTRIFK